jgi:hypothetical protein
MYDPSNVRRFSLRDFWSTSPYNNDIFSYTSSTVNIAKSKHAIYKTTGKLSLFANASSTNCPKGNLLIETGKRLYPLRNPGVTRPMVSVLDLTNNYHGYIDPESPIFVTLSPCRELKRNPNPFLNDAHVRHLLNNTLLAEPPS